MLKRYENKSNHPMYGKTHSVETLKLISKPGECGARTLCMVNDTMKKLRKK